jgi:hypothetical protein
VVSAQGDIQRAQACARSLASSADKAVDSVLQLAKTTPRLLEDSEILAAARG